MTGSPVTLVGLLLQEVLKPGGASILEVALFVAVVALAVGVGTLPCVGTPAFQGGDKASVTRYWGLKSTRGMRCQIHQNEGCLFVGNV